MKPGPAMSIVSTSALSASAATMLAAISRGFLRAGLARRIAMLLAKSPWLGVAGALDRAFDREISGRVAEFGQTGEGIPDKLRDDVFH